jgi:cytidyltransferase-like protein
MSSQKTVVVNGAFDDVRSHDLRFLEEAAKLGNLTVLLWSDHAVEKFTGKTAKFSDDERSYFLNAVRYVSRVLVFGLEDSGDQLLPNFHADIWADVEAAANPKRDKFCKQHGVSYQVITGSELKGFPDPPPTPSAPGRKKVVVTGCYDWFHSGHVRFCEEVSTYGDLYVIVGHDENIRLLKGEGHPLLPQDERRYVVGSIKYVTQSLISTGDGWLDADPEIQHLKPDIYVVNEDGDKGGKREYCEKNGIQYLVLKRTPAPGLPKRSSTDLRGF